MFGCCCVAAVSGAGVCGDGAAGADEAVGEEEEVAFVGDLGEDAS